MGKMRGMSGLDGMKALQPLDDLNALQERDDERLRGWVQRVGEDRAMQAWQLKTQPLPNAQGRRSNTLPELLAEGWLRQRNIRYEAQFDLGWARPDFVLFDVLSTGAMVWEINGEYWHKDSAAYDAARKQRLLNTTAHGTSIVRVVELWENDIYPSESVFDAALQGKGLRGI